MKNTFKNHIYICLDRSGSMQSLINSAVKVFNNQIDYLRRSSLQFEQETRVSFYTFNANVECVVSDVDVARPITLDSIQAHGNTAIMDSLDLAIQDAKLISEKYGDHSFMFYVITDGEENASRKTDISSFTRILKSIPDNYSIAAFVPNMNGRRYMENLGFPKGNIEVWDTSEKGVEEVGQKFEQTMNNFYQARSSGVRSSQTIFSDLSKITAKTVTKVLDEIKNYDIIINETTQAIEIKSLAEKRMKKPYTKGNGFYELVKTEHVQANKHIAVQNKKTGKVYTGDAARELLNLPNSEVKIVPGDFGEWIVYIQSNAVNRKIIPKQRVLVLK